MSFKRENRESFNLQQAKAGYYLVRTVEWKLDGVLVEQVVGPDLDKSVPLKSRGSYCSLVMTPLAAIDFQNTIAVCYRSQ